MKPLATGHRQRLRAAVSSLACVVTLGLCEAAGAQAESSPNQAQPEDARPAATESSSPAAGRETPQRCRAGVRLVGSVMNARHPERSKAALRNKHGTRVMGPGQRIDNLMLVKVAPTRAILRNAQGAACYIPVYLPAEERPKVAPPPKSARAQPARGKAAAKRAEDDALARSVRELGPGKYLVTREALMRVLANPAAMAKSASVRPVTKDGRTVGMQIVRLRPTSPLRLLGLQKGDVLRHLNGHSLSTPDGMLEAVRLLRTGSEVSLGLLRDNAVLTVSVAIQ